MDKCTFCSILARRAPAAIVYEDEQATAFRDVHPAGPVHILIVPNRHIASVNELTAADEPLVGHLFRIARQLAQSEGIDRSGYRLIINTGRDGGQTIPHLHLHLIGGRPMQHPMG